MKKTFKSKIELAIFLPLLIVIGAGEWLLIQNRIWAGAIPVALVAFFLVYMYLDTCYVLTSDEKLRIKSGFFYRREISIRTIHKVKFTRNHWASPAFSPDRLEIFFNRYDSVQISPYRRSDFINRLKQLNPKIIFG